MIITMLRRDCSGRNGPTPLLGARSQYKDVVLPIGLPIARWSAAMLLIIEDKRATNWENVPLCVHNILAELHPLWP